VHDRSVSPGGAFVSLVPSLRAHLRRKSPYHADPCGNGRRDNLSPHAILAGYTASQSRDDVGNSALPTRNHLQRLVFRVGYPRLCGTEENALLITPAILSWISGIELSFLVSWQRVDGERLSNLGELRICSDQPCATLDGEFGGEGVSVPKAVLLF
jgi:hypothetical protein